MFFDVIEHRQYSIGASMNYEGKSREKWSSWVAFVWVAAGAAVGLGNVWKFPYMAGSFGGSAFVLMYLFFVLLVAVPVMAAEIMLGKLSERNAVDGFLYLAKRRGLSTNWRFTGYLGLLTLQLIFCFYSVVAGFSIAYLYFGASNAFYQKSPDGVQSIWVGLLAEPWILLLCSFLFIFFTMAIVYFGIKKGIEKACTFMMPGLLLVLIVLVVYAALSGGFNEAFSFLFAFEPEKITPSIIISSLGHAFFTLAVGACAMMVYGSYLPRRTSVAKSVLFIALLDVVVALLAGLAIFPLIFEAGLSPSQGPGLMFVSLPIVFAKIPFGWFWATLFFILLFFAALSSSLSFAEPLVDLLMEKLQMSRKRAVVIIGAITSFGSIFCALSFNVWSSVKILNRWTIFDVVADISTNILLPIGGIAIAIFAGLVVKEADFFSHRQNYGHVVFTLWRVLTLFIAPIAILIVLINSLIDLM
jgi:NSS family neurotransmitter:Na+ symporter